MCLCAGVGGLVLWWRVRLGRLCAGGGVVCWAAVVAWCGGGRLACCAAVLLLLLWGHKGEPLILVGAGSDRQLPQDVQPSIDEVTGLRR